MSTAGPPPHDPGVRWGWGAWQEVGRRRGKGPEIATLMETACTPFNLNTVLVPEAGPGLLRENDPKAESLGERSSGEQSSEYWGGEKGVSCWCPVAMRPFRRLPWP